MVEFELKTVERWPVKDCCLHTVQAGNLKFTLELKAIHTVFRILISNWLVILTKWMSLNTQEQGSIPFFSPPQSFSIPLYQSSPSSRNRPTRDRGSQNTVFNCNLPCHAISSRGRFFLIDRYHHNLRLFTSIERSFFQLGSTI